LADFGGVDFQECRKSADFWPILKDTLSANISKPGFNRFSVFAHALGCIDICRRRPHPSAYASRLRNGARLLQVKGVNLLLHMVINQTMNLRDSQIAVETKPS
jgi:hypothetical protein